MTIGQSYIQLAPAESNGSRAARLTTPDLLRLLSAGATGAILIALADGPLRTKELTERVPGYAPRTIYRHAGKLGEIGVLEREEEPGVPSKVVHRLSDPCGVELQRLVEAYASASWSRLPGGAIGAHSWASLAHLADLWESGMVEELNFGPRTATELARVRHGLSYHQVSRRTSLFATGDFIGELQDDGRRRRYALTPKARRAMALVAGIGRWRRRHVVWAGESGLTAQETAALLRTALPLVVLPEHADKRFKIGVVSADRERGEEGELIWGHVEPDGSVLASAAPTALVDGWGRGQVATWVDALLDGPRDDLRLGGDGPLLEACLSGLHSVLWTRQHGDGQPGRSPVR